METISMKSEEELFFSQAQAMCEQNGFKEAQSAWSLDDHTSSAWENSGRRLELQRREKLLAELRVVMTVRIGVLEITGQELLDLIPGRSFSFEFSPEKTLELCVGDEVVAHARLVQEDDTVFLEVISVVNG